MNARIQAIEYFLPDGRLTNADLAQELGDWSADQIQQKTGIKERRIAAADERASDLAFHAAKMLIDGGACSRDDVDFVLLCTQSPDFVLPTTACVLQERLKLRTDIGALDFNLGCSGYIYGLSLAKALVETAQATKVLLLTAETYSKYIRKGDRSVRTIFGDAASATLISSSGDASCPSIGPFIFGTDGRGAENLIVRDPGFNGATEPRPWLYMNGREIFDFTLQTVPQLVNAALRKAGAQMSDIDLFIFHQANAFMLEALRRKIGIPRERFVVSMETVGNTVSCTIPIALKDAERGGLLMRGQRILLVGFGVGYSMGATIVLW